MGIAKGQVDDRYGWLAPLPEPAGIPR
jgi:hypothetical protein